MKKILTILIFTWAVNQSLACDICGCGAGSNYVGLLPEFGKKIFGLRYRHNSLVAHLNSDGSSSYMTTKEAYTNLEIWGAINLKPKLRLMFTVPYSFNERTNQGATKTKNGLSDITINTYYEIINSKKLLHNKLLIQNLWFGGGIKLPTGSYSATDKSMSNMNNNLFQNGTGSVDFSLNAMYDIRYQDAGISINSSYKINTPNKYKYQYGNKFVNTAQLYYKWKIKNRFTLAPNIGIAYETSNKDYDDVYSVDMSGGNISTFNMGCEFKNKIIAVGINYQIPQFQDLANSTIKADNKLMVHVSFVF